MTSLFFYIENLSLCCVWNLLIVICLKNWLPYFIVSGTVISITLKSYPVIISTTSKNAENNKNEANDALPTE